MTVIEALCSGSAVICADVESMTDLVSENQGWYFKSGNSHDMAQKMDYVLSHIDEVREKRENALESKNRFDGRIVAQQFEDIYKELIQKGKDGYYVPGGEKRARKYLKAKEKKG